MYGSACPEPIHDEMERGARQFTKDRREMERELREQQAGATQLPVRLLAMIRDIDAYIDAHTAPEYQEQPLAGHWARITKVCEEAGEVWEALSKCTGENYRKGVCGSWDDLLDELGDTVSAAACAIQHITKDESVTGAVIMAAFEKAQARIPATANGEKGE